MIAETLLLNLGGKLVNKLFTTPEEKAKAQAEVVKMAQSGELKELELLIKDRDSARNREMALGGKMNGILAIFILSGFFFIVGALFFMEVGNTAKEPLYILLGSLGTMATQVVAYYFGSSAGSKQKTAMFDAK